MAGMLDRVLLAVVAAVAIVVAGAMLADYLANPDLLWSSFYHDRNTHFAFGLDLALATRELDPLWFLSELDKAKVGHPCTGSLLPRFCCSPGPIIGGRSCRA